MPVGQELRAALLAAQGGPFHTTPHHDESTAG